MRDRSWSDPVDGARRRAADWIERSNTQHLRVQDRDGTVYLLLPLTVAVIAGLLITFSAPWLLAVAVVAGLYLGWRVEVSRRPPPQIP